MTDAEPPSVPPHRPSRQDLVVPPRSSPWPVAVGAVASAAAGFGLVLFLGIGRSRPLETTRTLDRAAAVSTTDQATAVAGAAWPGAGPHDGGESSATGEPGLLPRQGGIPSTADRWSARRGGTVVEASPPDSPDETGDRYGGRFATLPASHEASPDQPPAGEIPPPSRSRFSSDLPPPLGNESTDGHDETTADPTTGPAAAADPPLTATETPLEPPPAAVTGPAFGSDADSETTSDGFATEAAAAREALAPSVTPQEPAEGDAPAAWPVSRQEAEPPAATDPTLPPPGYAPAADRRPEAPPATDVAPAAPVGEDRPLPGFAPPAGLPPPAVAPFVAAPPLGPAAPPAGDDPPADPAAPAGLEGSGLPGPLQLEGVQAPQLAVEKRGPKEVQVGKPARYEILVRNVGSTTAREVVLRDAVPRGTSLIATTPPASPEAGRLGDLVWTLGTLPPGGEARVLVELMPEDEGDIGSIASVSFRADATLRVRATKPELVVDCRPPRPVRIGGDVQVAITISNPGSGDATGVVLEAFLPETVSHRAGRELEFDVGRLRSGESRTIELVLGTRSPGSQPARLVARADGGIEVDRLQPVPVTAPTLEVSIDMPTRRFLQRPATCAISMLNSGTASARSVELAAQLPPGMKFVRANNAGWHDGRTNRVLWNLEELPAGETGTVEVVVMPVQAGEQRITAAARSLDGPSDQAVHACQVEGVAALAFHVADSEDPIEVAGMTEYVVRVANEGTKAASGVRLAATLPGDLEPIEAQGPGRHRVEKLAVEFEPLARLAPGEEVVYRIRARGQRAGHQRVQVRLVSDDNPTPITKEEVTSVYDDR